MVSVALFLSLSAAIGIWKYLNQTQETVKKLTATRSVVIASKEIKAGAKIIKDDLAVKQIPVQSVVEGYFDTPDPLIGRIAKSTIQPNEIINGIRLVQKGALGGLSVVIPEGKRAITIMVNEVIGVGGFISPGDYVDVLSVYKEKETQSKTGEVKEGDSFAKTILQNVLILAVAEKIFDPDNLSETAPKIVNQVTIALTPQDSEKLTLAVAKSQLLLTLRPHGDNMLFNTTGATAEDVYDVGTPSSVQNVGTLPNAKSYKDSIELILGDARAYYSY